MAKASDNLFPYVHLVPAAAPASPAAGAERLFLDSANSNKLSRKNSSGTVTVVEGGGPGGGSSLTAAVTRYTGGTITCTTATAWSNLPGLGTVTLTGVAAGDKIIVAPSFVTGSENITVVFDIVTEVAGAAVNSLATGSAAQTGSPAGNPGPWLANLAASTPIASPSPVYVLQAGDLTGGNSVVLRVRHYSFPGTARTVVATTVCPATLSAHKVG